ncbi:MAG TPA: inositol 2-dehydrogenase [Clostridia bacterium]|jgi:myo-inositol 2-dehydrogenase/D-chiro-inositol 1-dehydrogenase|nr:inositol 2-dehydrogenase [Clostridia bacterium]
MVKVGIIGAGRIGKVHCESITRYVKNACVKAIADPFMSEDTAKWAKGMGVENIYTDYHKILEDKEIEAVLICSSTDTHSKISLEAIAAGKHIFCEKPIDHDVNRILEVKKALENSNVKFQVGFNRRFDHNFRAAREAVKSGKVGDLNVLKICSRDPGAPPVSYIKVSGGIFLDMTIHDFDMVRFMSGEEVEEVFAYGAVLVDPAIGEAGDIDTAIISMRLKSGALAVIDNCRRASYGYDQRVEVLGSKGQVAISNDTQSSAVISDDTGVHAEKPLLFFLERYMQAYVDEITEFIDCVVNDKKADVGVDCGLQPVLIGLAAKKSLIEKRPVKIAEIAGEYNI